MTLVEVVMAVTIFAIVFVGAAGAFLSGMKLWGRISKADVPGMFLAVDLQRLGRDLRGSVDIPQVGFQGSSTEVFFPAVEGGRIVRVAYAFDRDKKKLFRKVYAVDPAADEGAAAEVLAVTKVLDAQELDLSYLDRTGEGMEWTDAWPKEKGMFKAVRMEGVFNGERFTKIIILPQA